VELENTPLMSSAVFVGKEYPRSVGSDYLVFRTDEGYPKFLLYRQERMSVPFGCILQCVRRSSIVLLQPTKESKEFRWNHQDLYPQWIDTKNGIWFKNSSFCKFL